MHELVKLPLDEESVVFIVGNYKGRTAMVLEEEFHPRLFCFDPQPRLCDIARQRVPSAQVFPFGLGDKNGEFPLFNIGNDGCSFLQGEEEEGRRGFGQMVDISEFMVAHKIEEIDLFHINCQGYEWILFPYMLRKGIFDHVRYLMPQFHMAPAESVGAEELYAQILERFDLIWNLGAVTWQLYQRKGGI